MKQQATTPEPTTEEWVLHGVMMNQENNWLQHGNARLITASDDDMIYALAPLSGQDFTDARLRQMFDMILLAQREGQDFVSYLDSHVDKPLEATYQRLQALEDIGKTFGLYFNFNVFVDRVYELRLARLRKERPTFEGKDPAKARECAMAIACLQLAQEDLIGEF